MTQRTYKKYWFNLIKTTVQESCGIVPDLDYYNYLNATGKNIPTLNFYENILKLVLA